MQIGSKVIWRKQVCVVTNAYVNGGLVISPIGNGAAQARYYQVKQGDVEVWDEMAEMSRKLDEIVRVGKQNIIAGKSVGYNMALIDLQDIMLEIVEAHPELQPLFVKMESDMKHQMEIHELNNFTPNLEDK